jgi:hypothetical protein
LQTAHFIISAFIDDASILCEEWAAASSPFFFDACFAASPAHEDPAASERIQMQMRITLLFTGRSSFVGSADKPDSRAY